MMKFFLLLILLFVSNCINAQNHELSEEEYLKLEDEARKEINGDMEKALELAGQIDQSGNFLHKASAAGIRSYVYQLYGYPELSDSCFEQSFVLLAKVPNSKMKMRLQAIILNYGGLIQKNRRDWSEACKLFEKGKNISLLLNDPKQTIKFFNNMAYVLIETGHFKEALADLKESSAILMQNEHLYSSDQFRRAKAQLNYNLAQCYDGQGVFKEDYVLIDSAITYYDLSTKYAEDLRQIRISSQINMTVLMKFKKEYVEAEKRFFNLIKVCDEHDMLSKGRTVRFNLGELYFEQGKYADAQPFFESILQLTDEADPASEEYIRSNYFMARIAEESGDYEKAQEYLDIFLEGYEPILEDEAEEKREFSFMKGRSKLKEQIEIQQFQSRIAARRMQVNTLKNKVSMHEAQKYIYIGGGLCLLVVIFLLIRKNISDKRKAKLKLKGFMETFKEEEEQKKSVYSSTISNLTITDEKEKEIIIALEALVLKKYHLRSDFGLQSAAKKIKTNTTYLSHVVNKNYGKSFSEYFNELKINHVINELMENETYRKYSTQGMAESVGYKSATSFTRSFKKRTGVTPVQFLKGLEK